MNLQGIRYAVRSLVFDRGVSAIVIACLALGIGVNATLFSVVDGVLIQPLPYAEPARLIAIWSDNTREQAPRNPVSPANFLAFQREMQTTSSVEAM